MSAQRSARSALSHGPARSSGRSRRTFSSWRAGLGLVTALVVRERSCRVRDGAVDRVVEVLLGNEPARFDRPSLRVSPIAQLGGREDQIAEREDPSVGEIGSVSRKRE